LKTRYESQGRVGLITEAIAFARPRLESPDAIGDRLRTLWAAVVAARDMAADEVVEGEFLRLALDTDLASDLGRHAEADLRHVIHCAMLGQNPFQ